MDTIDKFIEELHEIDFVLPKYNDGQKILSSVVLWKSIPKRKECHADLREDHRGRFVKASILVVTND